MSLLSLFKGLVKDKRWFIYLDKAIVIDKMPLFEIFLSKTRLSFRNPPSSFIYGDEYFEFITKDERPFVNIRTQSEYQFLAGMPNGFYYVYKNAWNVYKNSNETDAAFKISFTLYLISPTDTDSERFGNLFEPPNAQAWLQHTHSHQNAVNNSIQVRKHKSGGLIIDTGEADATDNPHDTIVADDSPVPFKISTLSAYPVLIPDADDFDYTFYIPVSYRDILVFTFRVLPIDILNGSVDQTMFSAVHPFVQKIMSSVKLESSDKDKLWNKMPDHLLRLK